MELSSCNRCLPPGEGLIEGAYLPYRSAQGEHVNADSQGTASNTLALIQEGLSARVLDSLIVARLVAELL